MITRYHSFALFTLAVVAACSKAPDNPLLMMLDGRLSAKIYLWEIEQPTRLPYESVCPGYLKAPTTPPYGTEKNRLACLAASASLAEALRKEGYTTVKTEHLFDVRIATWYAGLSEH
jgi:hypothetical protein